MNSNTFSLIGAALSVVLLALWYFDIVGEPVPALVASLVTFLLFFFPKGKTGENASPETPAKGTSIIQKHTGSGDNIAGGKTVHHYYGN